MKTGIQETVFKQYPLVATSGHTAALLITSERLVIRETGFGFMTQKELRISEIGALGERLEEEDRTNKYGSLAGLIVAGVCLLLAIVWSIIAFAVVPGAIPLAVILIVLGVLLVGCGISVLIGLNNLPHTSEEYRGRFMMEIMLKGSAEPAYRLEMGTIINDMDNENYQAQRASFHEIIEEIGNYIFNLPFEDKPEQ